MHCPSLKEEPQKLEAVLPGINSQNLDEVN